MVEIRARVIYNCDLSEPIRYRWYIRFWAWVRREHLPRTRLEAVIAAMMEL